MVFSSKEISILVVEDNPGDFFLIQDMLKEEFNHVLIHEAHTFAQAREHLLSHIHFDAVLLDLSLPDSRGEALVESVLQISGHVPVIVLTGFSDKNFGIKTLTLGIADYLFKDELTGAQLYKSVAYSIERRRVVNELKESNDRYKAVSKATSDTIWDWDMVNGHIHYNNGIKDMLGYEASEVYNVQSWWKQKIHTDDLDKVMEALDEVFETGVSQVQLEYRFLCGDGQYKYILDRAVLVTDDKGKPTRMIGAMQDISVRKNHEMQMEELLVTTRQQNKRLQNFAFIVSHNIRSHSANIIGLVDFIGDTQIESDRAAFFNMLKTSTDKLGQTIENLNEIITIQNDTEIKKTRINLREEITKTTGVVNVLISQTHARLEVDIPDDLTVEVVESYLESILLNMITNAIKYRSQEREPLIQLSTHREPGYIVLSVKDNGLGIDMDKYGERMFGMYVTVHNHKDSRGFGLYITKNQIEAMEGKIELESTPGVGSTFKIYFRDTQG
jgi:PAS domain S-box-containing protein